MNKRKYSESARVISSERIFKKYASSPLMKRCHEISSDKVIMVLENKEIKLDSPVFIVFFILEQAKYIMYNFYYNVLKNHYEDQVSLVYTDTDSLLLCFDDILDITEEMQKNPLRDYLDTSNFPSEHALFNTINEGVLGKLKSETAENFPLEVIALQPKYYSILLNNSEIKLAAKGVHINSSHLLKHKYYKDIHMQDRYSYRMDIINIRSKKLTLFTTRENRNCLSKLDTKRYYLNPSSTLAYGHPYIEKTCFNRDRNHKKTADCGECIVCRAEILECGTTTQQQLGLKCRGVDLTKKRRRRCEVFFAKKRIRLSNL
jgi:hypothetical protein